jgi:Glycosyltransferase family 87
MIRSLSAGFCFLARFPQIDRMWDSPKKALLDCILVGGALLVYHYRERFSGSARRLLLAVYVIAAIFACWQAVNLMQARIRIMPQWDFRVFWAYGQLMARGENVYATSSYDSLYKEFTPDKDFIESVMHVGATYPPPTMFLFRPLGCCEVRAAYRYWYVFLLISIAVAAEFLRRMFLRSSGLWGLLFVLLLIFSLHGTWDTIRFGQTNFLALILFLLYWRDRDKPLAGLWIAFGAVIKLYFGLFLLDALIFRRWRVLLWSIGSGVLLALTSLLLLGPSTFFSYFLLRPTSRIPGWVYVEWMNQSLLGTILRITHAPIEGGGLARNPLFLFSALALAVATAWLVYRLGPTSEWGLSLWMLLALIIYPGTLAHYSVMLLPVLLLVWRERDTSPLGVWGTVCFITAIVGLAGFHSHAFLAYVVCWATLAVLSALMTNSRSDPATVAAQR